MSLSPIALEALRAAQAALPEPGADLYEDVLARALEAVDGEGRLVGAFQAAELMRLEALVASVAAYATSRVTGPEPTNEASASWVLHLLGVEPAADGITRRIAPTQTLREDLPLKGSARLDASAARAAEATHWRRLGIEDPHDSPLHHDYRIPHDLPPLAGA